MSSVLVFENTAPRRLNEFPPKAIDKISKASNVTRTMMEQLKLSTKLHKYGVGVHTQKLVSGRVNEMSRFLLPDLLQPLIRRFALIG